MSSPSSRIARTRGFSEQGGTAVAPSTEGHSRTASLPRPPRSEQRRSSQIYLTDTPLVDSAAPPLLPPLSTQPLVHQSSLSSGTASPIRRSAAQRDISLSRSVNGASPVSSLGAGSNSGARPQTPRGYAGSATEHRSSPESARRDQVYTPNGSARDEPQDSTPRQASQRTPRQRTSPGSISSLHSPPILLSRAAQTLRYHSSSPSASSSRPRTPSAEQATASRQQKQEESAASDSDYSVSGESSDSQGWTGIEHSISASPPKSPFLSQILAEARQHQSFTGAVEPIAPDEIEDIDSVEHVPRRGSLGSMRMGSLGRSGSADGSSDSDGGPVRWDNTTISRSMSSLSNHAAQEEKGPEVAWWAAEPVEKLEDPKPNPPRAETPSKNQFRATVSNASPTSDPTSPSQVGKAVEWDDSSPPRATTPQPSSYRAGRPSISPVSNTIDLPRVVTPPPTQRSPTSPTREAFRRAPSPIVISTASAFPTAASPASPVPRRPSPIPLVTPPKQPISPIARTASRSAEKDHGRLSPHQATFTSTSDAPPEVPAAPRASPPEPPAPAGSQASTTKPSTVTSSPAPPATPTQPPRSSSLAALPSINDSPAVASPSQRRAKKDLPPPPEKSRKRASTIRRMSRLPDEERPTHLTPPVEVTDTPSPPAVPPISSSSSASDFILDNKRGTITTPATPLSASDFAEAYGGREFGRSPSIIEAESASLRNSSHIRSPAVIDGLAPSPVLEAPPTSDTRSSLYNSYYASSLSRSDSLSMMADLTAQLSDAIMNVDVGAQWDDSAASTRRPSQDQAQNAVKRLSEAPSDDSFHEAVTSPSMLETELSRPMESPALPPLPVDASPAGSRSASPAPGAKLDAKAKAAAFIADLKKARAAAGETISSSTTSSSNTPLNFMSPTQSYASPSPLISRDSPSPRREIFHTPYQPSSFPSPSVAPSPPPLPSAYVAAQPSTTPSPSTLPSLPPQPPAIPQRTAANFERRPSAPGDSPALPALPTSPSIAAPSPALDRLQRRRPLPPCLSIAPDLKRTKTPGERAIVYATKINQLSRETSGMADWILAVRPQPVAMSNFAGYAPVVSPGWNRREASGASFPSRGDGYKAREIPSGSFSPRDLANPSVPFPGVLPLAGQSRPPISSKPPSTLNNPKSSFFGGLGRKASRRSSGGIGPISGPTPTGNRPTITGPLNVSSTSLASASGRPLGPRMPGASRSSLDTNMYSSPSTISSSPSLTQVPSRSSFTYGSSNSLAHMASPSYIAASLIDEDKIDRLENVLPQGSRDDLAAALRSAGGDEVLAVSMFLSDEAMKRR